MFHILILYKDKYNNTTKEDRLYILADMYDQKIYSIYWDINEANQSTERV